MSHIALQKPCSACYIKLHRSAAALPWRTNEAIFKNGCNFQKSAEKGRGRPPQWRLHLSLNRAIQYVPFLPTSQENMSKCTRNHNCFRDSSLWGIRQWIHICESVTAQGAVGECCISVITSVLIKWAPEFGSWHLICCRPAGWDGLFVDLICIR